jgi:hypothetical protein
VLGLLKFNRLVEIELALFGSQCLAELVEWPSDRRLACEEKTPGSGVLSQEAP